MKYLPFLLIFGCAPEVDPAQAILDLSGDAANGGTLYAAQCSACHGTDGAGGSGPSLVAAYAEGNDLELITIILDGDDDMPAYGETLADQEIADIWAYVGTL